MSAPVPAAAAANAPGAAGAADPVTGEALPSLAQVRGPDYPAPTATPQQKAAYLDRLMAETEQDALARYKAATHNILYANHRQHIGWKQSRRSWEDLPIADGEVRVTMNYIAVILRARLQRLVSSEVNWRGIPTDNSYDAHDKVKVAVNFLKGRYHAEEMEAKLRQGLMQAFCTGVCALKSFWNPAIGPLTPATVMVPQPVLGPDGQPTVDPMSGQPAVQMVEAYADMNGQPVSDPEQAFYYRPGDSDTALRTVFNLRLNPEATGWTEAEGLRWLIDEEIVPLALARERFMKIAAQIRPLDTPASALTYERIARGSAVPRASTVFSTSPYLSASQSQMDASKLTAIREYWEMRSPFFPRGRTIVVVGGAVAYDGPWPQGIFPYSPLFGEPAMLSPYGRAPVTEMRSPQDVINREWTAIGREMEASGGGQWVAWAIPGVPDQAPRENNAIIQIPARSLLASRPISDVIQRVQPASVSADRWRLIEQAKAAIFDIGAYHEVSRGQIPPGLDSGVAIQYLLEQESAQLKDAVDAMKRALILWGRHQLAIARWGYGDGAERWLPVDRPDLGYMVDPIKGDALPDPETIGLDIEYFRPQSESAVRSEVKELLAMQVIDPRKALKIMDLGAGFEQAYESETRHYARARTENIAFEKGQFAQVAVAGPQGPMAVTIHPPAAGEPVRPFLLADDDDHLIHIDVHQELALDETLPWPMRQAVLAHIAEHRARLQAAMMAQLQLSQPPEPPASGDQPGASSASDESSKAA